MHVKAKEQAEKKQPYKFNLSPLPKRITGTLVIRALTGRLACCGLCVSPSRRPSTRDLCPPTPGLELQHPAAGPYLYAMGGTGQRVWVPATPPPLGQQIEATEG